MPRGCSGRALVASVGLTVRACVRGLSDSVCVGLAVSWTGGLWCGWGSGLARVGAAGLSRVWMRWQVFGVVELGRRWGPGLGPFVGAWCRGLAQAGRLRSPYSCGSACFTSWQVMPGAPGSSWLRVAAAGVVALPVWMHVLTRGFVACSPLMVPERL